MVHVCSNHRSLSFGRMTAEASRLTASWSRPARSESVAVFEKHRPMAVPRSVAGLARRRANAVSLCDGHVASAHGGRKRRRGHRTNDHSRTGRIAGSARRNDDEFRQARRLSAWRAAASRTSCLFQCRASGRRSVLPKDHCGQGRPAIRRTRGDGKFEVLARFYGLLIIAAARSRGDSLRTAPGIEN